jgi:[acyl-carrier-protein] S-malonyltransferase
LLALLLPGQGSQYVGMGRDLAAASPIARATFDEADEALGCALSRIMWEGPEDELTATANAQPAILIHAMAVHRVLSAELGSAAIVAGHSLGEFTAYVVAGALGFTDGVKTVRLRGELMQQAGRIRPGTMAAVLGLEDSAVEQLCQAASDTTGECVPANYNSPGQVVISGDVPAVERAIELARPAGAKRALRLNVSGAFHSPLMQPAVAGLAAQVAAIPFGDPAVPVVSNVTAAPVTDSGTARRLLLEQLTSPVRWAASVATMLASGADEFIELGPGSVLGGLVRRIERTARARSIGTWAEVEAHGSEH